MLVRCRAGARLLAVLVLVLVLGIAALAVAPAQAATRTWRTDLGNQWIDNNDAGKWVEGIYPISDDDIILGDYAQWGAIGNLTYKSITVRNMGGCYNGPRTITVTTFLTLDRGTTCGSGGGTSYLNVGGNVSVGAVSNSHLTGWADTTIGGNVTIGTAASSTWTLANGNASVAGVVNMGTGTAWGDLNLNNFAVSTSVFTGFWGTLAFGSAGAITMTGGASTIAPTAYISGTGGSIVLANTATNLTVNRGGTAMTIPMTISGTGALLKTGTNLLTLTGPNSYSGATTVSAGTLQVGEGGTSGSIEASSGISVASGANLTFNRSDAYTATKVISGLGSVTKQGTGTTTLSGINTYTGATTITTGTLLVNGSLPGAGAVTVQTGATLGGSGSMGQVSVNSGGRLSPGNSPGTITVSGLSLPSGSSLNMELGQAGTVGGSLNDRVQDNGDLSLGGGTLNISVSSGGSFTAGTYRLIDYTGTLTNSGGLVLGTIPAGFSASQLVIDTSTAGQVNLIVLSANATYWDVAPKNNSVIDGGAGTWMPAGSGSNSNWTDVNGTANSQWLAGGTATFQGTPGTVTVSGAPDIGGVTFNTGTSATPYIITTGTLNGTAAETVLNAAAGTDNRLELVLGGGAYAKTGTGNIHLHGNIANTFTGAMDIRAGTLFVEDAGGLGAAGSASTSVQSGASLTAGWGANVAELITLNGGSMGCYSNFPVTGFSRAITLTAPSTINNLLGGPCRLMTGATLSLGANALTLSVPSAGFGILTAQDVISGTGTLTKTGAGTASLAAVNTYTGLTTVSGGTLQFGINSALPSSTVVSVASGATLDMNGRAQSLARVTGAGALALGAGGSLSLTSGASSIGAITGTGTVTLNPGVTLTLITALANTGFNVVLAGGTLNLGAFTHSIGSLDVTAASTLDFASAGTAQLTVATLNPAFALNVTNWTQGTDRFFATAVTGAPARNTINLSPLNRITLSGQTAQTTAWQSSNDEINALQAPTAAMVFSPTSVRIGANSTLSISLRNPNATALSSAAFSLAYPAGLNNASPAGGATTCTGGVVTAVNGGNSVALSGGTIPASSSCTVTVSVTSSTVAPYTNTLAAGALSSSAGSNAVGTLASLTVSGGAITGTVFLDDGAGGGTANDGIRNGSEGPQSGITMTLAPGNCSGAPTTYSSTVTDSMGSYVLVVPVGTATNAALCVAQSNQSGRTSTGASIDSAVLPNATATLVAGTSYTYTRAGVPDTIAFAFNGTGHSGVNFGDVGQSTFAAGGTKSSQPGNTVSYAHTFSAQTGGSVSFGIASAVATPALAGWGQKIHADATCSGSLQPGAALLYPPAVATTVTAGQQVCVIVQEFIPANALNGYLDTVTVQADFTFAGANPALVVSYQLTDVTKAGSGALDLKKEVRNVTQNILVFGVNNQAKTGETLEYRITYTNNGASPITNLSVSDVTPNFTTFISAVDGTTPASLTACQKNTPANALPVVAVACAAAQATGGTGTINFKYTGSLNPGATGSVLFQVRVD